MPKPARHTNIIPPYSPGLSKDEIAAKFRVEKPIKLASNENPLGPSPAAIEAMKMHLTNTHLYPDPMATELRNQASSFFGFPQDNIITGNGSDEIIDLICRAYLNPGDKVAIPARTFSYYRIASLACGGEIIDTQMDEMAVDPDSILHAAKNGAKIAFVANPNNPTGTIIKIDKLLGLIENAPDETLIVMDEAYAAFARAEGFLSGLKLIDKRPNLIVISTLSKSHGLAGMRIGFGVAQKQIIDTLFKVKPPFNMNMLAIKAGTAALKDTDFLKLTLETTWKGLDFLYSSFEKLGLDYIYSHTNFVLVNLGPKAQNIYHELLKRGIITRYIPAFEKFIRVSVGTEAENIAFVSELTDIILNI